MKTQIGVQPQIPIGELAQAQLSALAAEDLTKVVTVTIRKMSEEGKVCALTPEQAEKGLRQYYALPIVTGGGKEFAVSSALDPFWHTHLLDTREYHAFCARVYGRFMHHVPLDKDDTIELARVQDVYRATRRKLDEAFGDNVDDRVFPREPTKDVVICTYDYD